MFFRDVRAEAKADEGSSVWSDISWKRRPVLESVLWVSVIVASWRWSTIPDLAHQCEFQCDWGMRCGVSRGLMAQPNESVRLTIRMRRMEPTIL